MSCDKMHIDRDADVEMEDGNPQQETQDNVGYTWEESYKRSWDVIQEDEKGSLKLLSSLNSLKRKRFY